MRNRFIIIVFVPIFCLIVQSCSINKIAIKAVSNALTKSGSSEVFTSDSDPELVGDALPFAIKMYESLLSANPEHQGLLRMTGSLFVMYANAFIQKPAEQLPRTQFAERHAAQDKAKKMYLRGLDLLYRGLDLKYSGFAGVFNGEMPADLQAQQKERLEILAKMKTDDVPSLYWAAAGGISAFSLSPLDFELNLRVSEFLALAERAYELDPEFNSGALDDFLLLFYASAPEVMGGDKTKAEMHFKRALEKSKGLFASPYVSYAQAVSIPAQDYDTFKECLQAALAIDPDSDPANRLVNIISQRKARFLLDSASQYFINIGSDDYWDDYDWNDEDEDWDDENW